MVFPGEIKPLHPPAGEAGQPRVKELLARAFEWQARLQAERGLTQVSLAKELGMNRVRVTQIMNLLRLAPEIQEYILAMPPTASKRGLITENWLRRLIQISDRQIQVQQFRSALPQAVA